jgi:UDP-glucose 4-epimerase
VVKATSRHYLVIGGLGFVGSNFVKSLLKKGHKVTVIDDMSNGNLNFVSSLISNSRLKVIKDNVINWESYVSSLVNVDCLIHLASNADISASFDNPTLDFNRGTVLTQTVAELARKNRIPTILYASGSGVYGDYGNELLTEGLHELIPISTYGASKVAGEALLCSYSKMFNIKVLCFRFANVVGPQQTHGVAYDFLLKLTKTPKLLKIMGDGTQSKPYIHVTDVINAFMTILDGDKSNQIGYEYYNVASTDFLTVNEIAKLVCEQMDLKDVQYEYSGGSRGWKADVPLYRLNTSKIRSMGWENKFDSREAVLDAVNAMIIDIKAGKIKVNI